jgi:hypothetical protein
MRPTLYETAMFATISAQWRVADNVDRIARNPRVSKAITSMICPLPFRMLGANLRALARTLVLPEVTTERPPIRLRRPQAASDRSWPKADRRLPGDRKRKPTFDGQIQIGIVQPKAILRRLKRDDP